MLQNILIWVLIYSLEEWVIDIICIFEWSTEKCTKFTNAAARLIFNEPEKNARHTSVH